MHYVYIIYSNARDKFYVGETYNVEQRIENHNKHTYDSSYSRIANDWEVFWVGLCRNEQQAKRIEIHIKKMKSRKYYFNINKYGEIFKKLLKKYS